MFFNYHQKDYPYSHNQSQNQVTTINALKKRVNDLQQENQTLKQSVNELNICYTDQISLLQEQLDKYKIKYEELLQQKKNKMDHNIQQIETYQNEISKIIKITQSLHTCFEEQKEKLRSIIQQKNQHIAELQNQRQEDRNGLDQLVQKYLAQISRLQSQLKQLKEDNSQAKLQNSQIRQSSNNSNQEDLPEDHQQNQGQASREQQNERQQENPLKDISNKQIDSSINEKREGNGNNQSIIAIN